MVVSKGSIPLQALGYYIPFITSFIMNTYSKPPITSKDARNVLLARLRTEPYLSSVYWSIIDLLEGVQTNEY